MCEKRKSGVFFADSLGFKVSFFLEISQCRHVPDLITTLLRTSYNIRDVFELCRYRFANLTSYSEFMSKSDPVAKNRIEFQWGSEQPGTSSEALNMSWSVTRWAVGCMGVSKRVGWRGCSVCKYLKTRTLCVNNKGYEDTLPHVFLLCPGYLKKHKNTFKTGPRLEGYRTVHSRILSIQCVWMRFTPGVHAGGWHSVY